MNLAISLDKKTAKLMVGIITIGLFGALFLLWPHSVIAVGEDMNRPNNKFGIHIAKPHEEDIEKAAELVNSNGGGWGYVTVVMQEDDKDLNKWQGHFNKMRELRLIPIVRLATRGEGDVWRRPSVEDADEWADFLNALVWPVKNRYVMLFNEPNHAQEWGGAADPYHYAEVAEAHARALKDRSSDFQIMLAGLDAAAPSQPPRYMDSGNYLRVVIDEMGADTYEELVDAHASHSYPNPGFVGPPNASGKGTVRSYEYELDLIRDAGVEEELPVFITETGWDADAIGRERTAEYFRRVYEEVWLPDDRIRAVTPFILNYQGEPFLKFSWRKFESDEFHPQFFAVRDLPKQFGSPKVDESGSLTYDLPEKLVEDSNYHFLAQLENTGQGFWDEDHRYRLVLEGVSENNHLLSDLYKVGPGTKTNVDIYVNTDDPTATKTAKLVLYREDELVAEGPEWKFQVMALPSLNATIKFLPKRTTNSEDFEVQLFDEKEELVFSRSGVSVENNRAVIPSVRNIAFGRTYRMVVLHPGYLPRQTYVTFSDGENNVIFERMLPFDFDKSGGLTWGDIPALVQDPGKLGRWLP
ncbi:MAG: hypothetical protein ACOCXQ_01750 [Patescibacteria group bacterium]